ncbi:alpha/beta hydrolase [Streptomyces sp. HNM0575]|uniref:alpha/beta fold hydrolase n=1 Tax=Streptomyces sp. HNM0575 TaxID=2716338 RepID=UPI00145CF6DA|nr:alpha/beta hydrolase [Streptomyces sp. HNM0575]NLU73874.1 alpha/beta hydrolase [Streptomyces sp. HNM0575]
MSDRFITQPALADLAGIPARSRWVRSGTLRLHALDYGGDGVPLLLLPGITSPAVTMDFVARRLTDLVRPVVPDIRGRGFSDDAHGGTHDGAHDGANEGTADDGPHSARAGDGYTLEAYAEDAEAWINGLGLELPVIAGHSMGARIAAVTAVRAKVPVRGTVLVDPPMSGPGRDPYPTTLPAFLGQLQQARRGTDADEVARSWPRWPRREQELRARWLASCGEEALRATHHGFEHEDFFGWWPSVPTPTALLYGEDSPVVTPAGVEEATRKHPQARLTGVPDSGHMVFWDNPEAALDALRGTLRAMLA